MRADIGDRTTIPGQHSGDVPREGEMTSPVPGRDPLLPPDPSQPDPLPPDPITPVNPPMPAPPLPTPTDPDPVPPP